MRVFLKAPPQGGFEREENPAESENDIDREIETCLQKEERKSTRLFESDEPPTGYGLTSFSMTTILSKVFLASAEENLPTTFCSALFALRYSEENNRAKRSR